MGLLFGFGNYVFLILHILAEVTMIVRNCVNSTSFEIPCSTDFEPRISALQKIPEALSFHSFRRKIDFPTIIKYRRESESINKGKYDILWPKILQLIDKYVYKQIWGEIDYNIWEKLADVAPPPRQQWRLKFPHRKCLSWKNTFQIFHFIRPVKDLNLSSILEGRSSQRLSTLPQTHYQPAVVHGARKNTVKRKKKFQ